MVTKNARDEAIAEVHRWEETVARWQAEEIAAQAEHGDITSRMGEEILEDPTRLDAISDALQQAERTAAAARSTAAAAEPKLLAARHAVLSIDAAELDKQAAAARVTLDAHDARTAELLAALAEHEGQFVHGSVVLQEVSAHATATRVTLPYSPASKSAELRLAAERLELRATVLRDVIAGVDPWARLNSMSSYVDGSVLGLAPSEYLSAAVWGPESIVTLPAYEARIAAKQGELQAHDEMIAGLIPVASVEEHQAAIREIEAEIEAAARQKQPAHMGQLSAIRDHEKAIAELATLAEAPSRRAKILAELDALTGARGV